MVGVARILLRLAFSGTLVAGVATADARADPAYSYQSLADARSSAAPAATQPADSPSTVALRFFEALPPGDFHAALRAARPPRIAAEERARLLAGLPEEGELAPHAAEQHKLVALEPVLSYHDRQGVLDVKVIDLPHAGVVLYHRAVLLVSRPALRLLSAPELQAAVAHEIGHEYFWFEYEDARLTGSATGRVALELKCDGIAALTLLALGLDVSRLRSAMTKMVEFNEALGVTTDATGYPTVRERESFVRTLLKMTPARRQ